MGGSVPTAAVALNDSNCCWLALTDRGEEVALEASLRASVAVMPLAPRKLTVLMINGENNRDPPECVATCVVSALMATVAIVRLAQLESSDASK